MALVALGELGLDEGAAGAGDDLAWRSAGGSSSIQLLVAPEVAGLEQAGADGHVRLGQPHAVVDRAGGVADLQAEIPQHVEHVLDHLLAMGRPLVGQQEQQVDVGTGRQLAAAIAADRDQGQLLAAGRVGHVEDCVVVKSCSVRTS